MFDIDALINDVENTPEPEVYTGTEEVTVSIFSVRTGDDKNGNPYFMPSFELSEPGYKPFSKYFPIPHGGMAAKDKQNANLGLRRFAECFDIDLREMFDNDGVVNEEYLKGKSGWVILGTKDEAEYGPQNVIKKMMSAQ